MIAKTFNEFSRKDVGIAGGKGANLGELTKAGFNIPDGFVILSSVFDKFLQENGLDVEIEAALKKVNTEDINSVEEASEKIRDIINDSRIPDEISDVIIKSFKELKAPRVSVRSSATAEDSSIASWAGELESYLNVGKDNLLDSVRKCWSSLFTPRAIFYRFQKNLHDSNISVGVVVQKMIESEVSGITFTVHPVTEDKNQMVIEAGYGLGEAIVGGLITPDTYVVEKNDLSIKDKNISEQKLMIASKDSGTEKKDVPASKSGRQKLKDSEIEGLAKVCIDIEKHYKKPQDIEWAYSMGRLYILQSRPITTL